MNLESIEGLATLLSVLPQRIGEYDARSVDGQEGFQQLARMVSNLATKVFETTGRAQLEFHVFCTREPKTGRRDECVYAVRAPDEEYTPQVKDLVASLVAVTCKRGRAQACVFMSEAWMIEGVGDYKDYKGDESLEHRPGRREVLIVLAEHARHGPIARSAQILTEGKRRSLGPWVETPYQDLGGRFVSFLVPLDATEGGTA